jgi:hypothetical protein
LLLFFLINNPDFRDADNDGYVDSNDEFPNDSSQWIDSDGDGYGDNENGLNPDIFPNDPNEWSDFDGDGVGDNSDAFPYYPNEWEDTDGDGVGDNSDVFPNNPNEWSDFDNDGIGSNADKNPYVDLSFKITLDKFIIKNRVDILPWAQVYINLIVNNNTILIDDNENPFRVILNREQLINFEYELDINDNINSDFTDINIILYDKDLITNDDVIDINSVAGEETLTIRYNHKENTVSTNNYTEGLDGILWYNIELPQKIQTINDTINQTFQWNFKNKLYEINLEIPIEKYEYYLNRDSDRTPQSKGNYAMASYVTSKDSVIIKLSDILTNIIEKENFNEIETANFVLRLVQENIQYTLDNDTKGCVEYWRYPVETLVEMRGDCEDTSVLYSSIMESIDFDTVLLFYILENDIGHLAVGVNIQQDYSGHYIEYRSLKYYYCETTSYGFNLGEIPSDINTEPEKIIHII